MVKFLKRCLLVGKKVLYKSPIDIAPQTDNFYFFIFLNYNFFEFSNLNNSVITQSNQLRFWQ